MSENEEWPKRYDIADLGVDLLAVNNGLAALRASMIEIERVLIEHGERVIDVLKELDRDLEWLKNLEYLRK